MIATILVNNWMKTIYYTEFVGTVFQTIKKIHQNQTL